MPRVWHRFGFLNFPRPFRLLCAHGKSEEALVALVTIVSFFAVGAIEFSMTMEKPCEHTPGVPCVPNPTACEFAAAIGDGAYGVNTARPCFKAAQSQIRIQIQTY